MCNHLQPPSFGLFFIIGSKRRRCGVLHLIVCFDEEIMCATTCNHHCLASFNIGSRRPFSSNLTATTSLRTCVPYDCFDEVIICNHLQPSSLGQNVCSSDLHMIVCFDEEIMCNHLQTPSLGLFLILAAKDDVAVFFI